MFNEINEEEKISFFFEDIDIFFPYEQEKLVEWINTIIKTKGFDLSALNYIFCSDEIIDIFKYIFIFVFYYF